LLNEPSELTPSKDHFFNIAKLQSASTHQLKKTYPQS